ncbi:tryptophan--tRNA ligase, mitochondrial [Lepeophtheirus salmonis]|uniref:tryptophan--tRNA ligase, mitochondrial n=1 Tax=Lepeophtheirus salmonis TaxID=72036 RepID=UPI001AEB610E|nr:tryptophan--tRNA ligase, mitochondrial-like [Lepeophtheirus salmonis]
MYRSRAAYGIFSSYGGMRRFSSSSSVVVERTFSGIQPSGTPHLGNYFGAIKQWIHGQSSKSTDIFSIVDLHALTNLHDPKELRHHIHSLAAGLLASGLHPDKCILFQQSQVHEHTELCWILGSVCTVPALQRMTQFKDKTKGVKDPPLGLLIYPVLQCADILLYKGTKVPIGEDNLQNLEIARSLCRTFNRTYKQNYFPEPVPILSQTSSKIKNLRNPSKKMSKSDKDTKSCIYISDSPDIILEKCKKAVTDSTSELTYDPENRPGVSNLLLIHSSIKDEPVEKIVREYSNYETGSYKKVLADELIEHLRPVRDKYNYYMNHQDHLLETLENGNNSAREIASQTMKDVKSIVGFN